MNLMHCASKFCFNEIQLWKISFPGTEIEIVTNSFKTWYIFSNMIYLSESANHFKQYLHVVIFSLLTEFVLRKRISTSNLFKFNLNILNKFVTLLYQMSNKLYDTLYHTNSFLIKSKSNVVYHSIQHGKKQIFISSSLLFINALIF